MNSDTLPQAIKQASSDTWIYQGDEDEVFHFRERWGNFDRETLQRVLQEGHKREKVFALFALGYLAPPGVDLLLTPFLQSEQGMERWAGAISLGRRKDVRAFPLLQDLLLEGIFDYGPFYDEAVERAVEEAMAQWRHRRNDVGDWRDLLDRATLEAWEKARALEAEYDWCLWHRGTIALILGAWNDPHAVPALHHALSVSCHIEQQPGPFSGRWGFYQRSWHIYQDRLAYALGQLGAWGALFDVDLPIARQRIALTYLILGSLQVKSPSLFNPDVTSLIFRQSALAPPIVDPEPIARVLEERFGFSKEEQATHFRLFEQDSSERIAGSIDDYEGSVQAVFGDMDIPLC